MSRWGEDAEAPSWAPWYNGAAHDDDTMRQPPRCSGDYESVLVQSMPAGVESVLVVLLDCVDICLC